MNNYCNLLTVDPKDYLDIVTDAYTYVFGNEYKDFIKEKLYNSTYLINRKSSSIDNYCFKMSLYDEDNPFLDVYKNYCKNEREKIVEEHKKLFKTFIDEVIILLPENLQHKLEELSTIDCMRLLFNYDELVFDNSLFLMGILIFDDNNFNYYDEFNRNSFKLAFIRKFVDNNNIPLYKGVFNDEYKKEHLPIQRKYLDLYSDYIPSNENILLISELVKKYHELALKNYHINTKNFKDMIMYFSSNDNNISYLLSSIKLNNNISFINWYTAKGNSRLFSFMFFNYFFGNVMENFLHECGHIIEFDNHGTGFESIDDNSIPNRFNSENRIHERFNETINDMFMMEAFDYLTSNGIYLFENEKVTNKDICNINTYKTVKDALRPFFDKYRNIIIDCKLHFRNINDCIGTDNFNKLNDLVNELDYLCSEWGITTRINEGWNDDKTKRYYDILDEFNFLYKDIDDYIKDNNIQLSINK